jgi:hypothetical protein
MSAELEELQEIARVATVKALEGYPITDEIRKQLVLGVRFEGDTRVFELYIPGERPQDALLISQATVDRKTKGILAVQVFNPPRRSETNA